MLKHNSFMWQSDILLSLCLCHIHLNGTKAKHSRQTHRLWFHTWLYTVGEMVESNSVFGWMQYSFFCAGMNACACSFYEKVFRFFFFYKSQKKCVFGKITKHHKFHIIITLFTNLEWVANCCFSNLITRWRYSEGYNYNWIFWCDFNA